MKVVYARVSSDPDGTSLSPEAQIAECVEFAKKHGWDHIQEHVDRDISAWSRKVARPAWNHILDGIRNGTITGVIVHHLDRLIRQVRDLETLIDALEDRPGTTRAFPIYSVHGDIDLSRPDGRAMARILVTIAQKESDDKSRRLKLVLGAQAAQGLSHGGRQPYGWNPDRVTLHPVHSQNVRQLVDWAFQGVSLSEMARRFNTEKIPGPQSPRWDGSPIGRMLTNPRLAGLRRHNGKIVATGNWETIITLEEHTKLVGLFNRPQNTPHGNQLRWWATGVTVCGRCGGRMSSIPHQNGRRYQCQKRYQGCGNGILAEPVDQIIETIITHTLREGWETPAAPPVDVTLLTASLETARASMDRLTTDYYVNNLIPEHAFKAAFEPLQTRVEQLEAELADTQTQTPVLDFDIPGTFASCTPEQKRGICRTLIPCVKIGPAGPGFRGFDSTRIEVWLTDPPPPL
jgi:site-specific DNA recombinase